jgi:hypothetical protein
VILKLALAIGETTTPVAIVALPLTFAARLAAQVTEALREVAGESIPPASAAVTPSLETWHEVLGKRQAILLEYLPWILDQRRAGVSLADIAQQLSIGEPKLWRFLHEHAPAYTRMGTPRHPCDPHTDMIYAAVRAGKSGRSIAKELGINASVVHKWLKKYPLPPDQAEEVR